MIEKEQGEEKYYIQYMIYSANTLPLMRHVHYSAAILEF